MPELPSVTYRVVIIGVGNDYRGDDAAGLIVARKLRTQLPEEFKIIEQSGEGAALIEIWKNAEQAILVDAVRSGAQPGTVFRFEAHRQSLPTQFFNYSSHAFSVAEAVELARALKQLSNRLVVYGIEGKNFAAGAALSHEVEKALPELIDSIRRELLYSQTDSSPQTVGSAAH